MALTRLTGANALSGNVPAANFNNASLNAVTSIPSSIATGDLKFISTATASSSASIEFSLGDYKEYQFYFVNCHPQNGSVKFQFNFSTDNGSNYNVTKTTTAFISSHSEDDLYTNLAYQGSNDLAQSTAFQDLTREDGNGTNASISGSLTIFNPSSSTFVKHFISKINSKTYYPEIHTFFVAGYGNTISPITNIKFQFSSGNIDAGQILLFGVN